MRRFVTFYLGFALIPLALLFFLFTRYGTGEHSIGVSKANLGVLILLVGAVSLIGFLAMRNTLNRIIHFSRTLSGNLGPKDRHKMTEFLSEEGEIADLARSFSKIIADLEQNIAELEETKETLHNVLAKVGKALASMDDFGLLIRLVLETAADALGARGSAVFSWDEEQGRYALESQFPEAAPGAAEILAHLRPHFERVRASGSAEQITDSSADVSAGFSAPVICAPLISHGTFFGVLCIAGRKTDSRFDDGEVQIVESLSSQIALTYENMRLSEDRERIFFETISALALAVEARDPYSRGHSDRVGDWSVRIAESMGLPEQDVKDLRDAASLHDIGKIGIADNILRKPGALSDEEMAVMQRHPVIGEQIVAPLKSCEHLRDAIRHHHERLDGSGYPDGLKGDEIGTLTRVIMVADFYDAVTSARPYRGPMPWEQVKALYEEMVGKGQMDADVVGHMIGVVERVLDDEG